MHLVQLDSSLEERAINDADGRHRMQGWTAAPRLPGDGRPRSTTPVRTRPQRGCAFPPVRPQIRQQQLLHLFEVASRQPGLRGWIPGEVPDKHVRTSARSYSTKAVMSEWLNSRPPPRHVRSGLNSRPPRFAQYLIPGRAPVSAPVRSPSRRAAYGHKLIGFATRAIIARWPLDPEDDK